MSWTGLSGACLAASLPLSMDILQHRPAKSLAKRISWVHQKPATKQAIFCLFTCFYTRNSLKCRQKIGLYIDLTHLQGLKIYTWHTNPRLRGVKVCQDVILPLLFWPLCCYSIVSRYFMKLMRVRISTAEITIDLILIFFEFTVL